MTDRRTADELLRTQRIHLPYPAPGRHYTTCPECSHRRKPANQKLKCLGVTVDHDGVNFGCNHCGWTGGDFYERTRTALVGLSPTRQAEIECSQAEAAERARLTAAERLGTVRWLWAQRKPITAGSPPEIYLRRERGYQGPLPSTLGYLPARGDHGPAMVAAFGFALEPTPGRLVIPDEAVAGLHLTRLTPDGRKAGDNAKIMLGSSVGSPIVLAPPGDGLALVISEGIEDALTAAGAGVGAWAAGCAVRMPALAVVVPDYIECCTVLADADTDGQRHARALVNELRGRVPHVRLASAEILRVAA